MKQDIRNFQKKSETKKLEEQNLINQIKNRSRSSSIVKPQIKEAHEKSKNLTKMINKKLHYLRLAF